MEPIFAAQSKFRQNLGLKKVKAIRNSNYKAQGTKSYVYLMNRFGFQPTQPGPYRVQNKVVQRGLAPESFQKALGGRLRHQRVLVKATGSGDETGEVTADDQQNDSMYVGMFGLLLGCQIPIAAIPEPKHHHDG